MTKEWSEWEVVRHQVAIGGRVVDRAGVAVSGAVVTVAGPSAFNARRASAARRAGARWETMPERIDRTASRHDGSYFLLDLPDGNYMVKALHPVAGAAEKEVAVKWRNNGKVEMAAADLKLLKE